MPPLPERLERALVSNTRAIPVILTTPDIAAPAEKSIQETDRLIRVQDPLPVLYRSTPMCRQYLTESHRLASGITSGSGSLPIPVHAGLIYFHLGAIAVPLLSKLGDVQTLGFGQVVFWRQLALIDGIVIWTFIVIESSLSSSKSLLDSLQDLAHVGASITLAVVVRSDRSGMRCHD
jgi:hypothetical protein